MKTQSQRKFASINQQQHGC